jgi:hypothetical protein
VAVGLAQVPIVPVAVLVAVGAAQVPVALVVEAAGVTVVPHEVVLVLLHGEFLQMQMVQIQQLDGGDLLPRDGKVQLRKLILVGIDNPPYIVERCLKMNGNFIILK